ncbi:signal recognition particle-docking protein FtsY [Actinotignum sanguinis]|uniref:Signal recognition particle receptor FtsY n=2 Tax=Actinomycetaceae TaxID=2049 RepID=A0ABZ0RB80_9ACTO|nr:signal recognition particle-docking protein FtsY [Actinotignum sanguinis]WPJ89362.1 signal recognition particle-docking protein FtsY [Schaalia turicensis]MDE1552363.1 signal recognition particle-docking protein FtsY [Actinotignum sanguinis]MDE1565993.1 signal recognition particle-docking protein FtsY [Actinotignum sanguinis]MDE1577246.1 signal recognition particle-docking protein FtsY [Actinotignum sanguinis]MDE1656418.1 signal recognition particle-docking protein FtsY [Actinotignum sanguin
MDNPVVLALVIAAVAALLLVPLVISLVKKNQRREELERRNIPVLEGDSTAEAPEGADEETTGEIPGEIPGETAPDIVTVPAVEQPESVPSRMQRLRARLARSGGFGQALLAILSRGDLSAADWEELEDTLIMADVGLDATSEIMEGLRSRVKIESTSDPQRVREILREELLHHVGPDMDRSLNLTRSEADSGAVHPAAVLMVGVNGTGKTTTVGKLARLLRAQGTTVLLGAADTFRAAAADQLVTWGDRVGVDVVRSDREGADPASVAFDAVAQADATGVDVVIVDTAGRLQNKAGLMDELGKIKRVMERTAPVNEVLLVLDATTGQNGMQQARVFAEVTGLTGIVLTKLDGTAKGGIVISVQRELGVPVKLVGLGEGPDDLAPFDPEGFVDSLLS